MSRPRFDDPPQDDTPRKRCASCKDRKPLDMFSPSSTGTLGRHAYWMACRSLLRRPARVHLAAALVMAALCVAMSAALNGVRTLADVERVDEPILVAIGPRPHRPLRTHG